VKDFKEFTWNLLEPDPGTVSRIASALNLADEVAAVLVNRGIGTNEAGSFLEPGLNDLDRPDFLPEIFKAAKRIAGAVTRGEHVRVFGDYDADGITASVLLTGFLENLGCEVSLGLPQREEEYGLNEASVRDAANLGASLLVTVDCGSTSFEAAREAGQSGIDLVITDHHQTREELPEAVAVVNPRAPGNKNNKGRELAGVGVALYLVIAIRSILKKQGYFISKKKRVPNLREYLDLVALGTVADVVPLTGLNRILVRIGLEEIRRTGRPGTRALAKAAHLRPGNDVTVWDVAFKLAPMLNAAGRMGDSMRGAKLLLAGDSETADRIAAELARENDRRQALQIEITGQAESMIRESGLSKDSVLILKNKGWPRGIIGLVAGKLAEKYGKPAVIFSEEDELCIGSARSALGIDLYDALEKTSKLTVKWGGHHDAAGLTIKTGSFEEFRMHMNRIIGRMTPSDELHEQLNLECVLPPGRITIDLARQLRKLAPFGRGNPAPLFLIKDMRVKEAWVMGKTKSVLGMLLEGDGLGVVRAVGFDLAVKMPRVGDKVDLAGTPMVNDYDGMDRVQLHLKDFRSTP